MKIEFIYFCRHFWIVLRDIAPFWAAGIVGGSLVSVFAKERLNALFARISRGRFSIFAASAIGVASPLCMYGTVPLAASFSEKGMDDGVLAAFMMSSVLLNPQLMIYTAALGAEGISEVLDLSHIDRGYADFRTKLKKLGASIRRVHI